VARWQGRDGGEFERLVSGHAFTSGDSMRYSGIKRERNDMKKRWCHLMPLHGKDVAATHEEGATTTRLLTCLHFREPSSTLIKADRLLVRY
jgi:hypothetical protein